jgi:uncharacterized membrane protein
MALGDPAEPEGSRRRNGGGEPDSLLNVPTAPVRRPSASEFTTAAVHFYRAEVSRAVQWRRRLDTTTNWAVVTTAAAISFALGDPDPQRHVVILLVSILVTFFLLFEARRYRYYDVWETRVRLLERDFYAPLFDPEGGRADPTWQHALATHLRCPHYHISFVEALGWRLRRNYIWIYLTHLLTWFIKIAIDPVPIRSVDQFFMRATVGPVPGWIMVLFGVLFNGLLIVITLITTYQRSASGEIAE